MSKKTINITFSAMPEVIQMIEELMKKKKCASKSSLIVQALVLLYDKTFPAYAPAAVALARDPVEKALQKEEIKEIVKEKKEEKERQKLLDIFANLGATESEEEDYFSFPRYYKDGSTVMEKLHISRVSSDWYHLQFRQIYPKTIEEFATEFPEYKDRPEVQFTLKRFIDSNTSQSDSSDHT